MTEMNELKPVLPKDSRWGLPLIAGPCSCESLESMLTVARSLSRMGVGVLRGGVWKPRTKPGCFEGMGQQALPWLVQAGAETGMLTATEVGNAAHVRLALEAGVDILWIGARTSANPFAVQEIADTIAAIGGDVRVLVKNPVSPDLELWIGAIERIYACGVRRLGAVHRGFTCYHPDVYRNPPHWSLPMELRLRLPHLPLVCDPSHIGGRRSLIAPLSQQALDLGFDALMIEVHPDPDCALSDAQQQITPSQLEGVMSSLKVRRENPGVDDLHTLRSEIDECDSRLLDVLEQRLEISRRIGLYKKQNNMTVLQSGRLDRMMRQRMEAGEKRGLSHRFMQRLMSAIHEESVRAQVALMDDNHQNNPLGHAD